MDRRRPDEQEKLRNLVRQLRIDKLEELPPEELSTKWGDGLAASVAHRQVEAAVEQEDLEAAKAFEDAEKAIRAPRKPTPGQIAMRRLFKPRLH